MPKDVLLSLLRISPVLIPSLAFCVLVKEIQHMLYERYVVPHDQGIRVNVLVIYRALGINLAGCEPSSTLIGNVALSLYLLRPPFFYVIKLNFAYPLRYTENWIVVFCAIFSCLAIYFAIEAARSG